MINEETLRAKIEEKVNERDQLLDFVKATSSSGITRENIEDYLAMFNITKEIPPRFKSKIFRFFMPPGLYRARHTMRKNCHDTVNFISRDNHPLA